MLRRVAYLAVIAGVLAALTGCALSVFGYERRAAWRDAEERSCMSHRLVVMSAWVRPDRHINDRGACGIDRPLHVSAMESGTVSIGPDATLGCPNRSSRRAPKRRTVTTIFRHRARKS